MLWFCLIIKQDLNYNIIVKISKLSLNFNYFIFCFLDSRFLQEFVANINQTLNRQSALHHEGFRYWQVNRCLLPLKIKDTIIQRSNPHFYHQTQPIAQHPAQLRRLRALIPFKLDQNSVQTLKNHFSPKTLRKGLKIHLIDLNTAR